MSDFFKPLYKQHRRGSLESLSNFKTLKLDPESVEEGIFRDGNVFSFANLPGFKIVKQAVNPEECCNLVDEITTKFMENEEHLSNLDLHHTISRPIQMFGSTPSKLDNGDLIRDKIRWITLGGQYDWTLKKYPTFVEGEPGFPKFPQSTAACIAKARGITPQASIINFYKQGDILSPHQDVAELAKADLLSISLGCSCIFYAATNRLDEEPLAVLLESGDMVIMGGESRHAFHGVGRVFDGTCPSYLLNSDTQYNDWISSHRVNINIRQMIQ